MFNLTQPSRIHQVCHLHHHYPTYRPLLACLVSLVRVTHKPSSVFPRCVTCFAWSLVTPALHTDPLSKQQHGCSECRRHPEVSRPMSRWQPDAGHAQIDLADALTFTPTKEEFADPFAYIASIAERFVKQGIAKIVPPPGCTAPPQYVQQLQAACSGGGGMADELLLSAQRQFVSHVCLRQPTGSAEAAAAGAGAAAGVCNRWGMILDCHAATAVTSCSSSTVGSTPC